VGSESQPRTISEKQEIETKNKKTKAKGESQTITRNEKQK